MNWYILQTLSYKTDGLITLLNKYDDVNAFTPQMEYFHTRDKRVYQKPLFKGYIFIKTHLDQASFHTLIHGMENKDGIVRELKYEENTPALTNQEIDLFEHILDDQNVVRVSQACLHNGRAKVIYGPLKEYEMNIIKYDKHNLMAYLDISFYDRPIKAALMIVNEE